ncbi:hypothetical protein [Polyangium spumosum]|uniref:Tryptophan synthase alpha chain n=1 Tax=Polyangium spumosum TaxID=889282 RepID=A0A6N7Q0E3_9BACT|nr:hypothetical protein [Polyangium spumosum]MRG97277.1 hypothetical protein [Polyangium spumosum]
MHRHVLAWLGLSISFLAASCAPDLQTTGGNGGTGGAGGAGAGGAGGSGGEGGALPQCTGDDGCQSTECRIGGVCNAGTCEWMTVIMPGTPVGESIYGDCKRRECDASGSVTQIDDPTDKYDWGNPCYVDGCNAWMAPQPDPLTQCTTEWGKPGLCDISFKCVECTADAECGANKCVLGIGKCVPAHCTNGALDSVSGETDVDCGGPCAPCPLTFKCNSRTDCEGEGNCGGMPKACQPPNCLEGVKNGNETDGDCGGSCDKKCAQGKGCLVPDDCQTGLSCKAGTCQP